MSWLPSVGYAALGVLVIGWLAVSFSAPGPRRALLEWLSATAGFTALACLFVRLASRAWEQGSLLALLAFGFLGLVFCSGLCVSAVLTVRSLRGGQAGPHADATH